MVGVRCAWLVLFLSPITTFAASPVVHHVVGVVTYELMNPDERTEMMRILSHHPQFDERFSVPEDLTDPVTIDHWRIGAAGHWPHDVTGTEYARPKWHYFCGPVVVLGDVDAPDVPEALTAPTLATKDMYILDATKLALKVLGDTSLPDSDRAVALCWALSLIADGHQPSHCALLFAPGYPNGDQWGRLIKLDDGRNLHDAWAELHGTTVRMDDIYVRIKRIGDLERVRRGDEWASKLNRNYYNPSHWIKESIGVAQGLVYTDEVRRQILESRLVDGTLPPIQLPDDYWRNARFVSERYIHRAGFRASKLIADCVRLRKPIKNAEQ